MSVDEPRVLNFNKRKEKVPVLYNYTILLMNGETLTIDAESFSYEQAEDGDIINYSFFKTFEKASKMILAMDAADVRLVAKTDDIDISKLVSAVKKPRRKVAPK